MRTINFTVKIEDNDLTEHNLRTHLEGLLGNKLISIKTLPNTDHLKDNEIFKAICKAEKKAKDSKYDFVKRNRS